MFRAARAVLAGVGALALLGSVPGIQASAATCGNGIVEEGEHCDDGNMPGGRCSPSCTFYSSFADCGPPATDECHGECWGASLAADDSKVDGGKVRARTEP
jgi:cysteine-rich repeat protein